MSRLKFKGDDFFDMNKFLDPGERDTFDSIALIAQAIYDKHVEGLPKVHGQASKDPWGFGTYKYEMDTHTARLEDVKEIEK